jgi:hypothetical protein
MISKGEAEFQFLSGKSFLYIVFQHLDFKVLSFVLSLDEIKKGSANNV